MATDERTPLWATFVWISLWVLLLVNMVYDYIRSHLISPYSILMVLALGLGSTLVPRLLKQPNYSGKGRASRVILTVVLLILVIGYILFTIFLSGKI